MKFGKPPHLPAVVWDPASNQPCFAFSGGVLETRDKRLVTDLKQRGYLVLEPEPAPSGSPVRKRKASDHE